MRDITYTIHNNENLHNDEISIGIFLLIMNKRQNNIRNKSEGSPGVLLNRKNFRGFFISQEIASCEIKSLRHDALSLFSKNQDK